MTSFLYKAKTISGETTSGEVQAPSVALAIEILRRRKLFIVSIREVKPSAYKSVLQSLQRVRRTDVVVFTRQMSTMVAAGLPLTDALRIIKSQANPALSSIITTVLEDVEGGSSLGDALARHKKAFSDVYVALVRAGESAGVLDTILLRLATNLEKQKEFLNKVRGAMIYPSIVLCAMVIVATIMMVYVIPQMTSLYKNFNAELPAATKLLIGLSNGIINYWYFIIGGIGGTVFLFSSWIRTESGREKFESIVFSTPIVGRLQKFVILTEFTRTMSLLVSAGISIVDGLRITAAAVGNKIYKDGLLSAAGQVEKGLPLAVPIAQNSHFPPILSEMISVGEETGKVDEVLMKLSEYFESEGEQGIATLTAAVEPLIMIILGIGVGFLVISIILPIYNLTSSL